MVDMHSHFLPAIDDGAKNITEAAEMLRYAKDNGTDIIVATPHIRPYCEEDISEGIKKRNEAFSLLCNGEPMGFPKSGSGSRSIWERRSHNIKTLRICVSWTLI